MTYSCGIIRDLLPLYIDDVCNDESKTAVENHLTECEKCSKYYETMKSTDEFEENRHDNSEDMKMADSLKKIKLRINKKIRNIIFCSAAAALVFIIGFHVLFSVPIKEIDLKDIKVSADVYPIDELSRNICDNDDSLKISSGGEDEGNVYRIEIPEMPSAEISITEDVMKKNKFVTVVSCKCPYFIREIKWAKSPEESGDILYVKSFKTTVFGNKAPDSTQTMQNLEFREINKIVFIDDKGKETVLWSR